MENLLDFNVSQFIAEVRSRPLLYDSTSELYLDREAKAQAWEEILSVCLNGHDIKEEDKATLTVHLQKKWKNIRDTFVREYRKGGNRKRRYKYYKELMFLMTMMRPKGHQIGFKLKSIRSNDSKISQDKMIDSKSKIIDSIYSPSSTKTEFHTPNKKRRHEDDKEIPIQLETTNHPIIQEPSPITKSTTSSSISNKLNDECDSDKLFLMSLLSDLKRVPDQLKLEVKCDLMNVIKRYISYTNPQDSLQNCVFTSSVIPEESTTFSFKSSPKHTSDESDD